MHKGEFPVSALNAHKHPRITASSVSAGICFSNRPVRGDIRRGCHFCSNKRNKLREPRMSLKAPGEEVARDVWEADSARRL